MGWKQNKKDYKRSLSNRIKGKGKLMEKIVIKTKDTDSRNKSFNLITDGMDYKSDCVPGGYIVKDEECDYIGIRCEQITLYF